MQRNEAQRDEEIRQIAYRLWQESGCPDGHEMTHWLAAEALWLDQHGRQEERARPKAPRRRKKPRTGLSGAEL